ncbi:MAG: MetQ/NlpA family ABC transporter substrate-binding protein [Deltaproteobacteria bacterium]|jgi:D-methionine transport system substrate-binding protein|nr:MetQ/NlpA family ABC transporter substrate-binding protein [Deltaproteobacteria bacterium]
MKKLLLILSFLLVFSMDAFGAEKIIIGVTPFPHGEIMKIVKPLLAQKGYELEIKEFNDYVQPNMALAEGSLFANYFQHVPYLDNMNREKKLDLVWIAKIHIEPMGLYSKKIAEISGLKRGSLVGVPNDPTNEARALRLLETHGLISLKPGELVTVRDITSNPGELKFKELDAAMLPRTLEDVTAAVINTNFAAEAGLNPAKDALVIENSESPYANIIVVRAGDKDSAAAKALVEATRSPEVRAYIENNLVPRGILPVF